MPTISRFTEHDAETLMHRVHQSPVFALLTVEHQKFVIEGIPTGNRDSCATALALDLMGCQNHLVDRGLSKLINVDIQDIFDLACENCSEPFTGKDRGDKVWESCTKKHPDAMPARPAKICKVTLNNWFENHQLFIAGCLGFENIKPGKKHPIGSDYIRQCVEFYYRVGDRFSFNQLKKTYFVSDDNKKVELPLDVGNPKLYDLIVDEIGEDITDSNALKIIKRLGNRNKYNPVIDYFNYLRENVKPDNALFDNMAKDLLGNDSPLCQRMLAKTFMAAVARTMNPGCKHDAVLVLMGEQGFEKSTFINKMVPDGEWYTDQLEDFSNKDSKIRATRFLILECAELEKFLIKQESSKTKSFITAGTDTFRVPYGIGDVSRKRSYIIIATTNQTNLLNDATGSRRFWVIKVNQKTNIPLLEQNRDVYWATALSRIENGEQWHLDEEDFAENNKANRDYPYQEPWMKTITKFLNYKHHPTSMVNGRECKLLKSKDQLFNLLEIKPKDRNKLTELTMSNCFSMLKADYRSVRPTINGKKQKPSKYYCFPLEVLEQLTFDDVEDVNFADTTILDLSGFAAKA
jgi:hypothetical protein